MKKIVILMILLAPVLVNGQYNPQFSQLIKTLEFLNPGYNASKDLASATLLYRNQWTGFDGAPKSLALNVNVPVNKWHTGFGLNALTETRGLISQSNLDLTACVDVKVTSLSYLAFGLSGGAEMKRIDMDRAIYFDEPPYSADQFNSNTIHAGVGLNYFTPKLHLGAAMHYTQLDGVRYAANEFYSFYLNGSYLAPVHDDWTLKPMVLFKTQGGFYAFDAGLFALYKDIVWGGISYRLGSALIFFADVKITEMFRIGYSYDVGLTDVADFNYGSHEIRLEITAPRPKKKFERMASN